MVVMGMGDQDTVNLPERLRHNLLPEVGTTVDKQSCLFCFQQCRAAQPLVMRVLAGAGIALTPDGGYPT